MLWVILGVLVVVGLFKAEWDKQSAAEYLARKGREEKRARKESR